MYITPWERENSKNEIRNKGPAAVPLHILFVSSFEFRSSSFREYTTDVAADEAIAPRGNPW